MVNTVCCVCYRYALGTGGYFTSCHSDIYLLLLIATFYHRPYHAQARQIKLASQSNFVCTCYSLNAVELAR